MNSGPSANFTPQIDYAHVQRDPSAEDRHRAVRTVAACSITAEECAEFLAMLGLEPTEGTSS